MAEASWRDRARPIIAKVIARVGTKDEKVLRKALRRAYPFGQRAHWPYKTWCDEVQRQLGKKPPGARSAREHAATPDLFQESTAADRPDCKAGPVSLGDRVRSAAGAP